MPIAFCWQNHLSCNQCSHFGRSQLKFNFNAKNKNTIEGRFIHQYSVIYMGFPTSLIYFSFMVLFIILSNWIELSYVILNLECNLLVSLEGYWDADQEEGLQWIWRTSSERIWIWRRINRSVMIATRCHEKSIRWIKINEVRTKDIDIKFIEFSWSLFIRQTGLSPFTESANKASRCFRIYLVFQGRLLQKVDGTVAP